MNLSSSVTNIHLDNPADTLTSQFLSLLSSFSLSQHVQFPTHDKNHILDLVITSSDTLLAPDVSFTHWSPSDHFPVVGGGSGVDQTVY